MKDKTRYGLCFALVMYFLIAYAIYRLVLWVLDYDFALIAVAVWSVGGWFLTDFWESSFDLIFRRDIAN